MILDVSNPLEIMLFAVGVVCVLKRVADMESYHELRVFVLTTLLSVVAFIALMVFAFSYEDRPGPYCYPDGVSCFSPDEM